MVTPLTAIGTEAGLALEQSDGQLVGVQVLQVLAEVVVQEPGGKTLKHDVQLWLNKLIKDTKGQKVKMNGKVFEVSFKNSR